MLTRLPDVRSRTIEVAGVEVHYRETPGAGDPQAPTLLLLHGFPSGSHQFRRLIDALGSHHRIVAPDYPGFGPLGDVPAPDRHPWTFDWLADVLEGFVTALDLSAVVLYVFDWGGPLGFRLAERRPDLVRALVVQNANIADTGLSDGAREFIALERDAATEATVREMLTEPSTRMQYLTGVRDPSRVAPDSWLLDQAYLDRGDRTEAQLRLAFDYKSNVAAYARWQAWLAEARPPTLVVWGRHDPFFTLPGALAYLDLVPDAELHLFDTGHFALEDRVDEIATLTGLFLDRLRREGVTAPR